MFEKFGEFDSCEELNRVAAIHKNEGNHEALTALAIENGIDKEDAEDFIDGCVEALSTPLMAAVGKLKIEADDLGLEGILVDWKDAVVEMCMQSDAMQLQIRRKGKSLRDCLASMLAYAFENKVQVSDKVVKATTVTHNGRREPMRIPVYLGIPNKAEVKKLVVKYYAGDDVK